MRVDWVKTIGAGSVGLLLSGCVAAVPVAPQLTVVPGPGKTEATLRADDAACRAGPAVAPQTGAAVQGATEVTADQYYACMASHGESVVQEAPQVVPAYAAYPAYAYPAYAYPAYGYPYGYGYPYYGGWYGPYVGFGVGFGYGRFYGGRGFYGGYHGGYGFRGGYHGGYGGGFHGGGGGFHR